LEGLRYADIVEQVHSDIIAHEKTRLKINYSYGVFLRNVETDQLRHFCGSLGNAHMLDFAVLISNQDDLRSFLENICDFDMMEKIERPDTKWVLVTIINIIFFVSLLPDIPIGGGLKLPSIFNNKELHALVSSFQGREYVDNLCLFRYFALFDGEPLQCCERTTKDKLYQYCHVPELNPNKFPGVTLRELVDVEDIFEINVVVYALELDDQAPKATVVQLSRKKYERTMYVNLHESQFSYIFDVSKYCQRYGCLRCSEFSTSHNLHRHVRTCDTQVKHTYVGGVYNNKKFLDIKNYIAPGFDYAKFIRAYEVEQQKFYWPYEWFKNFQKLDEPTLPPHEAFYSSLKKENINQEAYALCQMVWKDKNWTSMRDHLEYYNNLDVEPFLQAVEKLFNAHKELGLDAFKSSLTLHGLTLQLMFSDLPPGVYFTLINCQTPTSTS